MFAAKLRELVLQNKINSVVEFLFFFFLNPFLFFFKKSKCVESTSACAFVQEMSLVSESFVGGKGNSDNMCQNCS